MAIVTSLPVRVNGSITHHTPEMDVDGNAIPGQFKVCFDIHEINELPVQSRTSGNFTVPETRLPEFLSGHYRWIGYMKTVDYLHEKLGITHLMVNSEIFEVSDI